jgi:hypothetical protein
MTTSFGKGVIVNSDRRPEQYLCLTEKSLNIKDLDCWIAPWTLALSAISTPEKHALRRVHNVIKRPNQITRLLALGAALAAPAILSTAGAPPGAAEPRPAPATATADGQPRAPASQSTCAQCAEFWLDLSEPTLSSIGHDQPAERAALLARIDRQQNEVLARVHELGGEEVARVKEVRNAVAVTLPAQAVPQARRIPGVLRVRSVQHRNRVGD